MHQKFLHYSFVFALLIPFHTPAQAQKSPKLTQPHWLTFQLSAGLGQQYANYYQPTNQLGPHISVGIGAHIKPNMTLYLKASVSRIKTSRPILNRRLAIYTQTSLFMGTTLQYWINNRVYIEGGLGAGLWDENLLTEDTGFSTLLGAGVRVFENNHSRITLGIENTSIFLQNRQIYSVGLGLGFQLK